MLGAMSKNAAPLSPARYKGLLDDLRRLWKEERMRAERSMARVLLRTYHRLGKRLLKEKLSARAGYGEALIQQLAQDLEMDARTLHHAQAFAKIYPTLPQVRGLRWAHYRELLRLPSPEQRAWYAERVTQERWSKAKLVEAISQGRYLKQLGEAEVGTARGKGQVETAELKRPREVSFVYRAQVQRVIDGDTLLLRLDLGFRVFTEQRVRLAAIDSPELGQEKGREAFAFVRDRLALVDFVMIKTHKIDLYGRYVAHVFYAPGERDRDAVFIEGRYLNQELVDRGLARVL